MELQMGTPEYLGKCLRLIRLSKGKTPEQWASEAKESTTYIIRLELGVEEIPSRDLLLEFAKRWELSFDETEDLMISAGYELVGEYTITQEIAVGAIKELLRPTS